MDRNKLVLLRKKIETFMLQLQYNGVYVSGYGYGGIQGLFVYSPALYIDLATSVGCIQPHWDAIIMLFSCMYMSTLIKCIMRSDSFHRIVFASCKVLACALA